MKDLPGIQQLLIGNGTLNADGTADTATAESLGWKIKVPLDLELKERSRLERIRRARER
jgi:hypothetical protein